MNFNSEHKYYSVGTMKQLVFLNLLNNYLQLIIKAVIALLFSCSIIVSQTGNDTRLDSKIKELLSSASKITNSNPQKALELLHEAKELSETGNKSEYLVRVSLMSGRIKAMSGDFENSLTDFEIALKISKENSLKDLEGKAINSIGNYYYFTGDMSKALEYYEIAIPLAEESGDTTGLLHYINNIGVISGNLGDYERSIKYYLKSLEISEKIGSKTGTMNSYLNIGTIYYEMKDNDKAKENYEKALELSLETNNRVVVSNCYINLGQILIREGNFDEAIECFSKAVAVKRQLDEKPALVIALTNLGSSYKNIKNYKSALRYLNEAFSIAKEIGNREGIITAALDLGQTCLALGKTGQAIEYFEECFSDVEEINLNIAIDVYKYAASAYYKTGNIKKAYQYLEKSSTLNDSLFNENISVKVNELQIKHELEKKEHEVELLQKEKVINELKLEKEILTRNSFIIGFIILFIIVFILFWANSIKKRNNLILQQKNTKIENQAIKLKELNQNKDKLFSVLAHDLRNPLASIIGYSELILTDLPTLSRDEIKLYNKNIYEVSNKLSNLLTSLLGWAHFQMKKTEVNFENINLVKEIDHIKELYTGNIQAKCLAVDITIDENISLRTDKNMLHSIIQNLLSNSIKYSNENSRIIISAKEIKDSIKISIKDHGIGIEPDRLDDLFSGKYIKSKQGTNKEKGSGLGLMLVKEMVDSLNGKVNAQSKVGEGTTIVVILPKIWS
ncbi:MAG: tetratricopeptide repeat-containing sensor histidine kinase [Ignavibacteria bacterium]|jgi:signal transduction histidine kinase/Tfp pilus assembly protein PilF